MTPRYFYSPDGRTKVGPLPLDELRRLARAGELKPTHMILPENTGKWQPASSMAELFAPAPTPAAQGVKLPERVGQVAPGVPAPRPQPAARPEPARPKLPVASIRSAPPAHPRPAAPADMPVLEVAPDPVADSAQHRSFRQIASLCLAVPVET